MLAGSILFTALGCGGAYDASVSGVVTLDGNSVNKGAIAFIPESSGPAAYAQIDSSGEYNVFTGMEAGLPSGDYKVTVVSREPPETTHSKLGGPPAPGKAVTPPWYAMVGSSPLQFQVAPGANEINLELKSTPPPGYKPPAGHR
jgi:hypothetical protein